MARTHLLWLHTKSFLASPADYFRSWRRFFSHGSQFERWSDISIFDTVWDERTQLVAQMVVPGSSVLEFGSGREQLERFLPEGCSYQPSDIAKRSERTLVCDLNKGFPVLDKKYDVIVFSGVSEYIYDLETLLHHFRAHCTVCLFTYCCTDEMSSMVTRLNGGWVTHYSQATVRGMIQRAGFHIAEEKRWRFHTLYRLT